MWIVHPQSVTHCQRRLAAKFQFIKRLSKTDKHILFLQIIIFFCRMQPSEWPAENRAYYRRTK